MEATYKGHKITKRFDYWQGWTYTVTLNGSFMTEYTDEAGGAQSCKIWIDAHI